MLMMDTKNILRQIEAAFENEAEWDRLRQIEQVEAGFENEADWGRLRQVLSMKQNESDLRMIKI